MDVIRRLLVVLPSAALLLCATPGVLGATTTAAAGATTLYAYAAGGATSPTSCPQTTTTSQQCTLADALSPAKVGDTVALATPGKAGHYVGNWSVATSGTSSAAPLTIKPAPGVTNPVLDGNHGRAAGSRSFGSTASTTAASSATAPLVWAVMCRSRCTGCPG